MHSILELPKDFDFLYLGCNPHGPIEPYSENLGTIERAFTTHAIYWSRQGMAKVLHEYTYETKGVFDGWLDHVGHEFNSYIISPMVALQRTDYSDIQGRKMEYASIMEQSYNENLMTAK